MTKATTMSELDLPPASESRRAERFERRRNDFINAASQIMNARGLRGMTLADVAQQLGMTTPSVRHYFKRKEELATACILQAIERVETLLDTAHAAGGVRERVNAFVHGYIDMFARIARQEEPPLASFSEVRTLEAQQLEPLSSAYKGMIRKVRRLLKGPEFDRMDQETVQLRAMYLFMMVSWSPAWLLDYDVEDYDVVASALSELLLGGLAQDAAKPWAPAPLAALAPPLPPASHRPLSQDTYLHAATQLINEQGYRGASVDAIAARLDMTKGAVYHHHSAKDDLVAACFNRSYGIVWRAQRLALDLDASGWERICAACAAIAKFQNSPEGPLLTNSALSALPPEEARCLHASWTRTCDRFAMMISQGIRDGSVRPVDANVAAQFVYAAVNSVNRLQYWLPTMEAEAAVERYMAPIARGLLTR